MKTPRPKYQKCKKPKAKRPQSEAGSKVFSFQTKKQALAFFIEVTEHLKLDAMRSTQATADGFWLVAVRGFSVHP